VHAPQSEFDQLNSAKLGASFSALRLRILASMLRHMRTSFELSNNLLLRARRLAKKRGITLRALVEEGLRRVIADNEAPSRFRLEDVPFGEGGLVEGLSEGDWERVRDLSYEGRGS
jgi:hypothetical protein